ncbi:MAG: hypothetical protein IJD48_02595 [Clostridia bacterium]|nr:hypothetical protein [Clostridia bacterium]
MLNIFKQERRYTVFDEKTYSRLLKTIKTMTTYNLDAPVKCNLTDYYYDNEKHLLEENELLLRRRVCGSKAELKIKRRYFNPQYYYSDNLRSHEREKEIPAGDPLSKHFFFLNNALNSMFSNNLKFDPDKLFEKVFVNLIIKVKQENRKLFGYGGLKVEVRHERLTVINKTTKRKAYTEIIQFKLLSPDDTFPLFEDFITRVEKHCKEIFYTKDSKHEIAVKCTKPLPTKEERKKMHEEMLKRKALEDAGELPQ